jgi:hypothetical protein
MLHVLLGDGEMSRRELSKTLEDLLEKAEDQDFWFIVQGKDEPTATDQALMSWITERDVYHQVITSDKKAMSDIYANAAEVHEVKRLAPKVLALMQEYGATEEAALFGLFVNNDDDVEEDRWLNDVLGSVIEEFKVYALNDGLVELGLEEGDEEAAAEEPEEEPAPAPAKKAAAKKAAPKAAAPVDDEEEEEAAADEEAADGEYTRDQLAEMDITQLKAVAATKGITLPPRTRMPTYIAAILGDDGTPEAEVSEVEVEEPSSNGELPVDLDMDVLAELIVDKLVERLSR